EEAAERQEGRSTAEQWNENELSRRFKERWLSVSKPERHTVTTSTSSVYVIVTNSFETRPLFMRV
ncbi:MAG: hypothetical protein ACPG8W_21600, partial [Candidatus Promineifilaceae bacterium]